MISMTPIINLDAFRSISHQIEEKAKKYGISYIDSAIDYCERNGLEMEFIGELILQNPNLKAKIENEAEGLNFLKRTDRLPI